MFKKKLDNRSHFLRDGVEPEVWWTLYEKAQKENNTLVRILNFDIKKLTIEMEDVPGFDLSNLNEIKKLTIVERRNITAQVVELYALMLKFHASERYMFIHRDFILPNIRYTPNKSLKLIDPDSFSIVYPQGPNSSYHGSFIDTLYACKQWETL
jgi:aminoglycoside/choline kinase family phosphotransferase